MGYAVRDRVEVRADGAWRPGTVAGVAADGRYIVQLDPRPAARFALSFVRAHKTDIRAPRRHAPVVATHMPPSRPA